MAASSGLTGAVVSRAPAAYNQEYMDRLIDTVNKLIEQVAQPQQISAASLILTALPHETPRLSQDGHGVEGEVYTKVCATCGCTVLAISQTLSEVNFSRRGKRI